MGASDLAFLGAIGLLSFVLSFIGASVGLVLGHLRLPLLIFYLGSPTAGAACNLVVSGAGALSGAANHVRNGRVSWHCLLVMGLPLALGAVVGAVVFNRYLSHFWAYLVIGVILVVSGLRMVRPSADETRPLSTSSGQEVLIEIAIGLGLGMLAAVTGLMLGSLRLPMMMRFLKMGPKEAVGSNMAVGCLTAVVASVAWFSTGHAIDWARTSPALLVIAPPTIVGGYLGGAFTGRLTKEAVKALAGWIIVGVGFLMVGQEAVPVARQVIRRTPVVVPDLIKDDVEDDFWVEDD